MVTGMGLAGAAIVGEFWEERSRETKKNAAGV